MKGTETIGSLSNSSLDVLGRQWKEKWQQALNLWSPYIRLKKPIFCATSKEEESEGLTESFAMIRLYDLSVVVSLQKVHKMGLDLFSLEIMAHEIGHHVFCPADLADLGRMIARIKRALPTREQMAGFISNLYSDLLINDRLVRVHNLKIQDVYRVIKEETDDPVWNLYMRMYEILWALPRNTLTSIEIPDEMEADAQLGNRVIRHYARDWLAGAGRFAALFLPYLLKQKDLSLPDMIKIWLDTSAPGDSESIPAGLVEIEADEIEGAVHPALEDEDLDGGVKSRLKGEGGGNYREPFEYGEILKSIGINLTPREIAIRYYRERAIPHLIPFPTKKIPQKEEQLPEDLETWEIGSPLEQIDWFESITRSPVLIPGYTTLERTYGGTQGVEPEHEPVDIDIYVDCSGSMPDPAVNISYPALAGAIICLSALRTGSRVQATLWSGKNDFKKTEGFIRNEREIMAILTGYIGGSTAFPIHILRETYKNREPSDRKVHILVISDDGVDTLLNRDEKGNMGADIARCALENGGGGGTFVLNLNRSWKQNPRLVIASDLGFQIFRIKSWEDLLTFSREFTKRHYETR